MQNSHIYSDSIAAAAYLLYYTNKLYKRNKEQQHPYHCISRCTRSQHWQTASATIIKGAHWCDNEPYFKVTTIQCDLIYNPISIIIDDDDMCVCERALVRSQLQLAYRMADCYCRVLQMLQLPKPSSASPLVLGSQTRFQFQCPIHSIYGRFHVWC